jgi:outer membrane protein OmpA-like peptidoglycan-associated protein
VGRKHGQRDHEVLSGIPAIDLFKGGILMKTQKALLAVVAFATLGGPLVGAASCQVEGQAKVAQTPPPPPPAPPPPASTAAEVPPAPPPPAPRKVIALKGVQMKSATQIDMPGDIEFQKASAKIVMNDKTKKVLTQLAGILKDNPEITKLSIEGNTDNEGEGKGFDNEKLSEQRAQSVIEWLAKSGVDTKRLTARGNGSKNPLAANDTPEHMAENRRVEFHVREFDGKAVGVTEPAPLASASPAPAPTVPPGVDAKKPPPKKDTDKDPAKAPASP